jgi:hypothetical protein
MNYSTKQTGYRDRITVMYSRSLIAPLLCLALTMSSLAPQLVLAQSSDREAPEINNLQITEVSATSVTITWDTDEDADSAVNYGLQPNYGIVRIPETDRTEHAVKLDGLEAGRTYYFRVVSADENGNQGISADYRIQTNGPPQAGAGENNGNGPQSGTGQGDGIRPDPESQVTTNELNNDALATLRIIEQINQISDPQRLQEIISKATEAAKGITDDLTIVGPPTVIPETTSALVKWTTDRAASSEVQFSASNVFDGTNYEFSQTSTGGDTTDHEIRLIGLEPFTDYNFKVLSTDELSITGESRSFTFQTKATAPDIRNLRVVKVEENAATLAWETTVPAKALVEYQDLTTGGQSSVGRPTLATTHQMRLADLTLGTRYVAFVTSENSGGDRIKSQPIQFITVRDIASPIITNVTNESTLFPGSESRIQTIIEWDTDEPSSCLITYQEGVAGGTEPFTIEKELVQYSTAHVEVIVDFAPATVYQFFLTCTDEAGNAIQSENFVLFTPIQEKNIIDLILENFESTFGWVQNIGA